MKKTLTILSVLVLGGVVAGCSNSSKQEEDAITNLSKQVEMLSQQVGALEANQREAVNAIRAVDSTADAALKESMRANQRLDNMATSYTK
uniref:Lpp/OprI family alanine-zipper lipoprotein n=1 Tax=Thaumasiovibrio occultus TaxID=1891184 RepID=UPI000B3639A6|nr:Lpp/OprI family alanine-zipper lipoprotein [Thaumasiovibrio occultus]